MSSSLLDAASFALVVRHTPLVSIDLVVRDASGALLVGLRRNRPAQNYWFVPGGRIARDESLDEAFRRICCAELGQHVERSSARFVGVYEHFYNDNFSGDPSFGTHYIVLAHALRLERPLAPPLEQHSDYLWLTNDELLARPDVHPNTQAYCRS